MKRSVGAAAPRLLRDGRHLTLRRWIDRLPPDLLGGNPWLLYWHGQAHARHDEVVACDWYKQAYARFDDGPGDALGKARCAAAAILAIDAAESSYSDLAVWSARLVAGGRR